MTVLSTFLCRPMGQHRGLQQHWPYSGRPHQARRHRARHHAVRQVCRVRLMPAGQAHPAQAMLALQQTQNALCCSARCISWSLRCKMCVQWACALRCAPCSSQAPHCCGLHCLVLHRSRSSAAGLSCSLHSAPALSLLTVCRTTGQSSCALAAERGTSMATPIAAGSAAG